MKKSYLVHCQPEITGDGKSVHFKDREELLSVLGFCASETRAAKIRQKEEVQEIRENDIPVSRSEKHHYAGPPRSPFGTMGREAELADETR